MIRAFQQESGVEVLPAWGMTEMSPVGTLCTLKNKHLSPAAASHFVGIRRSCCQVA